LKYNELFEDMRVLMHLMPWFDLGPQNTHWTMQLTEQDGMYLYDRYQTTGRVAAHYTPLVGVYDSKDTDVIDLHLDLMKQAGVDGIALNFYGTSGLRDYGKLLMASDAIVERAVAKNMTYTVCLEDRTLFDENLTDEQKVQRMVDDLTYIKTEYIEKLGHVVRRASDNRPVIMVFGPDKVKERALWDQVLNTVFSDISERPYLQGTDLANRRVPEDRATSIAPDGNYLWVGWSLFGQSSTTTQMISDFNNQFYTRAASQGWEPVIGGAWPRFRDYYAEGSAPGSTPQSWWSQHVQDLNGATFEQCFLDAEAAGAEFVQLITWNDIQEGTQIEPTAEDGFKWLLALQQRLKGSTDEDAMERRVMEYNLLKSDTWGRCDNVPVSDRVNCAGATISTTAEQCEGEMGCCWRETSTAGAPYCFQKAAEPITDCVSASVRDCELRPLDRLCTCKHAQPPPPPTPPPPAPPPSPTPQGSPAAGTVSRIEMPWWIVLVSGLAGVGASALVCTTTYYCMTQNERDGRRHRVLPEGEA
jgi:hypothetical protein